MDKIIEEFKDTRSMSSYEVDLRYKIPMILRQQKCWKFASVRRNDVTLWYRKL